MKRARKQEDEKRIAPDGVLYTKDQFIAHFGADEGQRQWRGAGSWAAFHEHGDSKKADQFVKNANEHDETELAHPALPLVVQWKEAGRKAALFEELSPREVELEEDVQPVPCLPAPAWLDTSGAAPSASQGAMEKQKRTRFSYIDEAPSASQGAMENQKRNRFSYIDEELHVLPVPPPKDSSRNFENKNKTVDCRPEPSPTQSDETKAHLESAEPSTIGETVLPSKESAPQANPCPCPEQIAESPAVLLPTAETRARARLEALQLKYAQEEQKTHKCIPSTRTDFLFGVAIVLQSINLGIEMELMLDSPDRQLEGVFAVCLVVKSICVMIFLVDLGLHFRAMLPMASSAIPPSSIKGIFNYYSLRKYFQILDSFLILGATFDVYLSCIPMRTPLSIASSLRLFLLWYRLCVTHNFYRFPKFQVLMSGLANALIIASWSMCLLLLVCYCGSLFCSDLSAHSDGLNVLHLFDSIPRSMLTHIELAMSEDWPNITMPLFEYLGIWRYYVAMFVFVVNILLLNVATGVMCEKMFVTFAQIPPLSAEVCAKQVETFWNELQSHFERYETPTTLSGYITFLGSSKVHDLLHKFDIYLPRDRYHACLLLLNNIIVDRETPIPFEFFFEALLRLRGVRTDYISKKMQYDIAKCDRMFVRSIAEVHYEVYLGRETCDRLALKIDAATSMVSQLSRASGPPYHQQVAKPLTMEMFHDMGCELFAELQEISRNFKDTLTQSQHTLEKIELDMVNNVHDLVLDERSSLSEVSVHVTPPVQISGRVSPDMLVEVEKRRTPRTAAQLGSVDHEIGTETSIKPPAISRTSPGRSGVCLPVCA